MKKPNIMLGSYTTKRDDIITDKRIVITGRKLTLKWEGKKIIVWSEAE